MPEHMHPTSTNRGVCMICMAALLLVGTLSIWAEATAGQISAAPVASNDVQGGAGGAGQSAKSLGSLLNADGTLNLSSGFSGSLDTAGWHMVSAAGEPPRFVSSDAVNSAQSELKPTANEPEAADDENWQGGFGEGANGSVYAVLIVGNDLYIGGIFTQAGGMDANYIAEWNGSVWSAMGAGTDDQVLALTTSGGNVYAGGRFTHAGGVSASHVAMWNTTTHTWSALGSGTDDFVLAMTASGSTVYAGGGFTHAGGISANYIAQWNGTS